MCNKGSIKRQGMQSPLSAGKGGNKHHCQPSQDYRHTVLSDSNLGNDNVSRQPNASSVNSQTCRVAQPRLMTDCIMTHEPPSVVRWRVMCVLTHRNRVMTYAHSTWPAPIIRQYRINISCTTATSSCRLRLPGCLRISTLKDASCGDSTRSSQSVSQCTAAAERSNPPDQ